MEGALARAAAAREADLADLVEELRIPSISALPERREDCLRNAQWLRDRMQALGMKVEIRVKDKDRGQLIVSFESNDDFERMLEVLRR